MTSRPAIAAPILAALAIVLAMIAAYVGAYLAMGECGPGLVIDTGEQFIVREFPYPWQATTFRPAGQVEAWLRQTRVDIEGAADDDPGIPTGTP